MSEVVKTMKLRIRPNQKQIDALVKLTEAYRCACNFVSQYAFDNNAYDNHVQLIKSLYHDIRDNFDLKAQLAQSCVKTVVARYKTVKEQLKKKPYKYRDEQGKMQYIRRTLEWLWQPILFSRPQADLVRNRDYSFVMDKKTGKRVLSINTLEDRILVSYDLPKIFAPFFDGSWSFGTGKIVQVKGKWYFHIPLTKQIPDFDSDMPTHVVGIDRGLRFLATAYDETGKVSFINGKEIMHKREHFAYVRAELQSKGTKSAKRVLKRLSLRENRWMTNVNHQLSKTLVEKYGPNTLFVMEDLTNVSFAEENLSG